ncbi:MAG: hypothetical protein IPF57_09725 [Gammaproteobacteria bacterium]|nr:hypothetical protein [Gammaproteobacteria bacterium]
MDGCVGAEVLARSEDCVDAAPALAKAGIRQSWELTTRNRIEPGRIRMERLRARSESFEGLWSSMEPARRRLQGHPSTLPPHAQWPRVRAARKLFDSMANTLVDALCRRAREVYWSG